MLYKTVKLLLANKDESYAILRYIQCDTAGIEMVDPNNVPLGANSVTWAY